jgi:putative membrane protein
MVDFFSQHYFTLKALHLIAMLSWMAGLLYLPRLYVYHCQAKLNSEMYKTFAIMEYKLLKVIMNPAIIAVFILGLLLAWVNGIKALGGWFHVKLLLVIVLAGIHGLLAFHRKQFALGQNKKSATYYRILNEVPAVIMVLVIFLAVLKPF